MLSLCVLYLQCPCPVCAGEGSKLGSPICMIEVHYDKIWKGEEGSSIGCVFAGLTNIFF